MKTLPFILSILVSVSSFGQSQYPAGIVYGPKAAYKIDAPKDWILDNKAGLSMGLPCVLYVDGFNWQNSPVIMYAKIAATNYERLDDFVKFAIKEFKKEDSNFKYSDFKSGTTGTHKYRILDYVGGPYKSYERVLYVQMEKAVGYVVFSAQNESDFKKYAKSVLEVVDSFKYKPEYINFKE